MKNPQESIKIKCSINSQDKNLIDINDQIVFPANFTQRASAAFVDTLIILALSYLTQLLIQLMSLDKKILIALSLNRLWFLYYFGSLSSFSTTIGGKLFRIYTIKNNREKISIRKAFIKSFLIEILLIFGVAIYYIYYPLSQNMFVGPTLIIGMIIYLIIHSSVLFSKNKRSLIDLFSGTKVVSMIREEKIFCNGLRKYKDSIKYE